jgi:uncharacterized lipoprotein YbaY
MREAVVVPQNSELRVRLVKRGQLFNPERTVGERTYALVNRQFPVEFEIPYNPNELSNRDTYVVMAEVTAGGQRWFASSQSYEVLTHGKPSRVEVWVERLR